MIIYLLLYEKFLRISKDIIFKFNLLKNRALKYFIFDSFLSPTSTSSSITPQSRGHHVYLSASTLTIIDCLQ